MIVFGGAYDALLAFVLGLVFGSLASVLSHRLPLGHNVIARRSTCPRCGATLGARDLVPLASWIALGGRCRHCGQPIGIRYPVLELATGLAFVAAWFTTGFGPDFPMLAALSVILVVISAIDIDYGVLPNPLQLAAAVLAPGWWLSGGDVATAALSGSVAGLLLAGLGYALRWMALRLMGREALGLGDVKLMGVAGLWMGLASLPLFLVASGFLGIVTAFIWRATGRGAAFPFGPALAMAMFICLVLPGPAAGL